MNYTALNINANTIKALARHDAVLKRQEAPLAPGAVRNGLILQPETMGRDIRALFNAGKLSGSRVVYTINGLPFTYRILSIPAMEPGAFHEAVLRTAKNEMSISPDEMYLSWQVFPGDNGEYQVLVTGITRRPVDSLIKTLKAAGISPGLLDIPHLALARLCSYHDAVIVDLEKDCSNIVMIVDGVPRGMHIVPSLAEGASLQDQVGQVMDKLAKMVEFYNSGRPSRPVKEPVKVLVTGELLEDERAFDYLRSHAGYNIEPLTPRNSALTSKSIIGIAVNTGMLDIRREHNKIAALSRPLDLNDIVKENRPRIDIGGIVKKVAVPLAVVAGIGLLTVSYLSLSDAQAQADSLRADLAQVNHGLVQKKALVAEAKLLENQISEISARVDEIESGREKIFTPREYVDDIASIVACMPADITFDSLEIDSVEISLRGSSASAGPVVAFVNNLEDSGKFSQAVISWIDQPHDVGDGKQLFFSVIITRE